jgi:pimeloyl-ACP methyl ester carboxylesterase
MMHPVRVNDVDLSYIEQGTGPPVVFVHGAFSDIRYWEPQRQAIATHYRFMAYNARYHGPAPWPDAGQQYAWATRVADLVAFMRWLNAGPVHLVGLSAGGRTATLVAVQSPDLVRSLTLAEPGLHELLVDLPEAQPVLDERTKALVPIDAAIKAGEAVQATKWMFELVNNQGPGAFDTQPEALRQMILDNARTLPLSRSTPPLPAVSRATLGSVKVPTLVVGGEHTLRYFALINEVVVQGIPGSRLVVIPQATHLMSYQNPAAFNEVLLHFLAQPLRQSSLFSDLHAGQIRASR